MKSFYSISTLVAVMALSMVFLFQGSPLVNLITLVILLILLVVIAVIPTRFIFPAALSAILVFGFFLTGWNLLSESAPAQTELIVHHLLFTLFVISSWLFFSQAKTIVQVNKELMSLVHYLKKYEPNTNLLTNSEFEERVNIMLTGMKRRKEPGFLIHLVPKYQSYARVALIDSLSQAILKTIRTNYDLVTYNSDGSFSLFLQNTNESGVKTVLTRLESNASDFLTIEQSPYTVHLYEMIDYNLKKSSKFLDQKRMEA